MIARRHLLRSALLGALALLASPGMPARAQTVDTLKLFVPAAPGGGWDQTARTMEQVLRNENLIKSAQITNVPGAGGTVGLPQFLNQWRGRGSSLMIGGMVMVGSILANKSPVKLTQTVPIARLTGESLVLVVPADSKTKNLQDFLEAFRADPRKVAVAGGSAGGSDHILLGLIGKAAGVEVGKLNYVAYAGGGPAQAALLGGHVAAGISGWGEFAEQIKAGKLRPIAISADKRQEGIDVPTFKEQGLDVELFNWRGVFAPPGIDDKEKTTLVTLMERMAASKSWKEELEKRGWTDTLLTGSAFERFLAAETQRIEGILKDLGLAA